MTKRVTFAPGVPRQIQRLLERNHEVLIPPGEPTPDRHTMLRKSPVKAVTLFVVMSGLDVGLWFILRYWFRGTFSESTADRLTVGLTVVLGLMVLEHLKWVAGESRAQAAARRYHGQYQLVGEQDD